MKKRMVCVLLALCLGLGLTACGNGKSGQTTDDGSKQPEASQPAPENTEPQLSGKVTVYMPSPAGLADKLAAAFT